MKVKLLAALLLFACQLGFSQTQKTLTGTVSSGNSPMMGVEVINKTLKISATTNAKGEFSIAAKVNDSLLFFSKEYHFSRLKLSQEIIDKGNLSVSLLKKPEELEEVIITKMPSISWKKDTKWEQDKLDQYAIEKAATTPKVVGVYTGGIENAPDFIRMGGMIIDLLRKEKEPAKKIAPTIEFKELARSTLTEKFYLQNLNLKPHEIELFLQFCAADPHSKTLIENSNILSMMDFIFAKNAEFKKLGEAN